MVTVIADQEEFSSPVQNGANNVSNDQERSFHYIKDYQEVDFYRSPSCKPFPEDLPLRINNGQVKFSINGVFFVQIDALESIQQSNPPTNQNQSIHGNSFFLLTLTDGMLSIQAVTNDEIPNLNVNVKPGCKLLITGVIPIENGFLQLSHNNTQFQFGSRTYPRPRSACRGRGGGPYRPSYEGRRGGGGNNGYSRQEYPPGDSNFFKRPPAKNTLMDFMTTLKISRDPKVQVEDEKGKAKEMFESKRRHVESTSSNSRVLNSGNTTNSDSNSTSTDQPVELVDASEGVFSDSAELHEAFDGDGDDDPSQSIYRERRNPLPPRLQRAQEERSRRNTLRHYDETMPMPTEEITADYRNGTTHHSLMSSSSSSNTTSAYLRHSDPRSYMSSNPLALNPSHPSALHSYATHPGMISAMNNSGATYLAYFPANPGQFAYNMSTGAYPTAPTNIPLSYPNETLAFCYGNPYAHVTYVQAPMNNGYNDETKSFRETTNPSVASTGGSSADENEVTVINESQTDETNEQDYPSAEGKSHPATTTSSSPLSSSNDEHLLGKKPSNEQFDRKTRDANANPRPRWKVNDVCLARWSEDRQFYMASILQIQPPFCTVIFLDYQNCEQVHFSDLKALPRDQSYSPLMNPVTVSSSDLNPLAASAFYPMRGDYYPPGLDGCLIMPEAPPFPFNSAGTMYMYPTSIPVVTRSTRSGSHRRNECEQLQHLQGNGETTSNATSSPSKDSNDTSINDSTTTSNDDCQQQHEPVISSSLKTEDEEEDKIKALEHL